MNSARILFWWTRSSRTPWTKSTTSYSWWKLTSEKIVLDWAWHGYQGFWETQNSECAKLICVASWSERIVFIKRATQEVAKKLKNGTDVAVKKKMKQLKFYAAWSGTTNRESIAGSSPKDYKNIWTSSKTRRSFMILIHQAVPAVLHQPPITSRSRRKPSREFGLLRDTREKMSGNAFACQPVWRNPDELHNDSGKLATSSGMNKRDGIGKSDSGKPVQAKPIPCFQRARKKSHDSGDCPMSMTHNHAAGINNSKWHDKLPGLSNTGNASSEFQSWRVNFRTDVCSKAKNPCLAMIWIKEIETAKTIDDLITPKSITGTDFPDNDELDMMMTAALKKCYDRQTHFRKKISVEEQRAQKNDRFLRGRQIAFVIYDHFRSTGSYDQIQGLSGLFSIRLGNDDIQDFVRREQALLSASDPPSNKILEGLYFPKLQDSCQLQTLMALFNSEIRREGGERDYHRLRICVKLHVEQAQRSKNFRIENEATEWGTVIKGEKGQKSFARRKTGECFQWETNGSCSKGESCSFLHEPAVGKPLHIQEKVGNTGRSRLKPAASTQRERTDWRTKLEQPRGESWQKSSNSLCMGSKMQYIVK